MVAEGKIKSKDLTYEASLPPFLQRLHDQKAGRGDPDRHDTRFARPKRAKDDDAEDGPTVVDESGDNISKEDLEKLQKETDAKDDDDKIREHLDGDAQREAKPLASGAIQENGERKMEQKTTDGKATQKRKAAKVVGEEAGGDEENAADPKTVKKAKKKTKPIKLAFDDGDG